MIRVHPINGETWLICGGRNFANQSMFDSAMSQILELRGCPRAVIHGGASSADSLAATWGRNMGIDVHSCTPDWKTHGRAGGPIRNQKMLDTTNPRW